MYSRLFVAVILLSISGQALGGAALVTPHPWSTDESSTQPCGAGTYTSTVSATYYVGVNQSAMWWAESGAGYGPVHARIDPTGGTSFANGVPIGFFQPTITANGFYNIYFIVPYVKCKGTNNTCTMQFWTDSGGGWYACATVDITCTGCSGGEPVSRDQCVTAQNLNFCSTKDGAQVYIPTGGNVAQIDGLASHVYGQNIVNTGIFTKGSTAACQTAYKEMMCELYLAPCGGANSNYTTTQCQAALSTCGITQAQANLYNCSIFSNKATSTSSSGSSTSASSSTHSTTATTSVTHSTAATTSATHSTTATTSATYSTTATTSATHSTTGSTTGGPSPTSSSSTTGSPSPSTTSAGSATVVLSPLVGVLLLFVF